MSKVILKIKGRGRDFFFSSLRKKKRMPANKCRWNDRIGKVTTYCPQWFGHKSFIEANTHLVKGGDRGKEAVCTVSEYHPTDYLVITKGEIWWRNSAVTDNPGVAPNGGTTWFYRPLDLMQHEVTASLMKVMLNLNIIKSFDPTSSLKEIQE